MPSFLEFLRQQNIFGAPQDNSGLPYNSGLPAPATSIPQPMFMPSAGSDIGDTGMGDAGGANIPPPTFDTSGIGGGGSPQNPYNVSFGRGPLDINKFDIQQAGQGPTAPQGQAPLPYDAAARMRELYHPTTDAEDRLNQFINQYPQEQKPSILRRIASMIVDYTKGPREGAALFNEPEQKAIMDWKNKVGPIENAATQERGQNTNERIAAYETVSSELRNKAQEAKDRNDEVNAKIRQQRADIYAFKATHPDWKLIMTKGGNVMAINPQTGETQNTGIPTGSMTEMDKLNLQNEQRLGQIAATGTQARETEGVKQAGREAVSENRGWSIFNIPDPANPGQQKAVKINAITGEVKDIKAGEVNIPGVAKPSPGGAGGKGEQPTQTRVRQFNKAREILNSRPDLAPFIKIGTPGANDFTITKHGKNFFGSTGPSPAQYDEMVKIIYGDTVSSTKTPPAPAGWKYVPKQGGGWTAIPDTSNPAPKVSGEVF